MKIIIKIIFLISALFIFISNMEAQIYIIVNKSVNDTEISRTKLVDIFTLNKLYWNDGSKITVLDLKGESGTKTKFYNTLGFAYSDIRKIWLKKQFSGKAMPPKSIPDEKELVRQVAAQPGAIAYISGEYLNDDVKVIAKIE
ncbi:MAG: hypothetical protein QG635_2182 [Bacteroidota bacterium]|nr:hypothetical protein [Bacteroidota bacterium]